MIKKIVPIALSLLIIFSLFLITTSASVDHKGFYIKDEQAINFTPATSGSNIETLISGDVLKIWIKGTADPNFSINLNENVDTSVYKILALKIKKSHAPARADGEFFYNVKGSGAVGGKSKTFSYAEGTDYQWCHLDLSAAGQVGYLRFDPYNSSPSADENLTLAYLGFFKSVDDMNTFANSAEGQALGSNEGDKVFYKKRALLSAPSTGPGIWLNTVPDTSLPGFYAFKFNALDEFSKMEIQLFASKTEVQGKPGEGIWLLFKFVANDEFTLSQEPVAYEEFTQNGDAMKKIDFGKQPAGQYIFFFQQYDNGGYLNLGTSDTPFDESKIDFLYNGTLFSPTSLPYLYAEFEYAGNTETFFGDLIPDYIDHVGFSFEGEKTEGFNVQESGRNTETLLSGDVLKIWVKEIADPYFGIFLDENVDTSVYKYIAIKVKKSHNPAVAGGEFYYNAKGSGAAAGKSVIFNYAEGTDYQWCYVDISAAGPVGFLRYDVYPDSPSKNEDLTLAYLGFFRSTEDIDAFANSDLGKALGTNEGDKVFYKNRALLSGPSAGPGIWLNTVPDASLPGFYAFKFNALNDFNKMALQLFASKAEGESVAGAGRWKLYKFDTNDDITLSKDPIASSELTQDGDAVIKINFGHQAAGQYIFYIEQDNNGGYFNLGCSATAFDENLVEFIYNGNLFTPTTKPYLYAEFEYAGTGSFFGTLIPNSDLTEPTTHPETGDFALITLISFALISTSTLRRKRKVK